ncbi:hypothetical protein H1S01_16065 [Heliobacterium chlorum]|uniref:IclR-ED domain-containing protein n=1 Tax=Heliobacterium chlorum TaxID=2698 RepID=A0ABR7T5R9_HELCL|nr:hypothetical protein [Heliobacterium chlorum]
MEAVNSPHALRVMEPIGMRLPLYRGASKKVILAHLPLRTQQEVFRQIPEVFRCDEVERITEELVSVRDQGYAVSYGETTEGTVGLAVAIFSWENKVVGSLSLAGPELRFQKSRMPEMIYQVRLTAMKISEELGWIKAKPAASRRK